MRPSWAATSADDTVTAFGAVRPSGRFLDFGAVHVLTTADLDRLRADGAPDTDIRRFRPNLLLSLDRPLLPGDHMRLSGGVELVVTTPTPRCAVPGSEQPGVAASADVLRAIGRRRTEIAGIGSAACVGVYADVVTPGAVNLGEVATLAPA